MTHSSTNFRENLYKFLAEYLQQHATSPTFAEITAALGISPKSKSLISRSLRTLEKEGKIRLKREGRRLHIKLTFRELPLLGRISAGSPIEAITEQEFIDVHHLFYGVNRFALQVKGRSMIDEGIMDGDLIVCQQTSIAQEGDIAVVLIDNHSATLKHISFKEKDRVTLIPANANLKPKAYLPERISIQGIYIGLIRTHS
jgi:repressor LexA